MLPTAKTKIQLAGRAFLILLGMGFLGWWMAALAIPPSLALGTVLVLIYLFFVGLGGVVPASAWVSFLVALLVAHNRLPVFWPEQMHYKYWAITLLLLWLISLGMLYLIAVQGQQFRQFSMPLAWLGKGVMLGSLILCLQGGMLLFQAQWPNFMTI